MLRMKLSSSLAAVLLSTLVVAPASAADPPVEPAPVGRQDPAALSPAALTPTALAGGVPAVVDLASVPASQAPAKAAAWKAHIQGEYLQHQAAGSPRSPISSSERGEPTVALDLQAARGEAAVASAAPGGHVVAFEGVPASGWIPPDTVAAVGPEYIVEAVNSGFRVSTKTGVETRGYTDFASFVHLPSPWNGFCYDPRVIFDPWSDQFVMLILGLDTTNLKSYFWVMVSQTDNPNGAWWLWRYDATTGPPGSEQWLDFASLGSDPWGLYVVGNSFAFAEGNDFQQSRLWSLNRGLMNGGNSSAIVWNGLRWPNGDLAFGVQVAQAQSVNGSQATYFLNNYPAAGTQVCLWRLTGDRWVGQGLGDATLSHAAIEARTYYGVYNNVDQPGSAWDLDAGDCRIQNAVYSQGRVYTTFGLDWDGSHSYSEVYVAAFNTGDSTKAWDTAIWHPDYFMFYPAIAVAGGDTDPAWMVAMSMTVPDDPLAFAGSIAVSHDPATDTGSFWWDKLGLGPYSVWDSGTEGVGRNRWGDYSMAVYDWWCGNAWGAAEYATASNSWATRIFARTMADEPPCRYLHVSSPNGGEMLVAGSTHQVDWDSMNIPSADELWVRFDDGGAVTEYGPLAPGATSYEWTVPNVSAPGAVIEVGAWDPSGSRWHARDSSDELFAVLGLADLVHQDLGMAQPVYPGGVIGLDRRVRNAGAVPVASFEEHLALSPDAVCAGDDPVLSASVIDDLAPDELDDSVYVIQVPPGTPPGLHYLCLILDPSNLVPEYDETNNTAYRAFEVLDPTLFSDGFESGDLSRWSSKAP